MNTKTVVVIGASAGGFDALKVITAALPKDFPAPILIVNHVPAYSLNILPRFLEAGGELPAVLATDWGEIIPGKIYVGPADHHLLVDRAGYTRLTRGPKENRFRPAIDPLFRSAAAAFGSRVIGVVLTGYLDDGTAGLWAIKERGGIAVVQHPDTAFASGMPMSAIKHVAVDHILPLQKIASLLVRLTNEPSEKKEEAVMPEQMQTEINMALEMHGPETDITKHGTPSLFACPECHGVLLRLKAEGPVRFRCHTGHGYSLQSLLADFDKQSEDAIWNAVRSLEESVMLLQCVADALPKHDHQGEEVAMLVAKAEQEQRRADLLRLALRSESGTNNEAVDGVS